MNKAIKEILKKEFVIFSPDKYRVLIKNDKVGLVFHSMLDVFCVKTRRIYQFLGVKQGGAWDTVIFMWFLFMIFGFGLGGAVSIVYTALGYDVLSIFNPVEAITVIFSQFIVNTSLWATSVWQVKQIPEVFRTLLLKSTLKTRDGGAIAKFAEGAESLFSYSGYGWVGAAVSIYLVLALWRPLFTSQNNPFLQGHTHHWGTVWPFYEFAIFYPLILVSIYFLFLILIRLFCFGILISKFYDYFQIKPILLHPDGANGLGIIGTMSMGILQLVVAFGLLIPYIIFVPKILFQSNPHLVPDTILMLAIYIVFLPIVFFTILWATHKEMQKFREKEIGKTAQKLTLYISNTVVSDKKLSGLQKEIELKKHGYVEWPLRRGARTNASLGISAPVVASLITVLYDYLVNLKQ